MNSKIKKIKNIWAINYFLEQRNMENMREVEKKDAEKQQCLKRAINFLKIKKGKHCRIN
jgi:ATP-binding cassette subfamily F protein 3